jgi:hypothetical protein
MAMRPNDALQTTGLVQRNGESTVWRPPNNRLQRTVMDKVPRHIRQRAAAEPRRYTVNVAHHSFHGVLRAAISALRCS